MDKEPFTFIDIGGGTDTPDIFINDPSYKDIEYMAVKKLRAARLASENPNKDYIIIDTNMSEPISARVAKEIPNLHFIKANGTYLPIRPQSADVIEINHLFYPIFNSYYIEQEAQLIKQEKELDDKIEELRNNQNEMSDAIKLNSLIKERLTLKEKNKQFLNILFKEWDKHQAILEKDNIAIEDLKDFFNLIVEAAKALKPKGQLVLAEKKSRTDIIERILNSPEGKKLLEDSGLELSEIRPNEDENRSAYAENSQQPMQIVLNRR
jgi:uncharacterized protein YdcH (DUF465 family)